MVFVSCVTAGIRMNAEVEHYPQIFHVASHLKDSCYKLLETLGKIRSICSKTKASSALISSETLYTCVSKAKLDICHFNCLDKFPSH